MCMIGVPSGAFSLHGPLHRAQLVELLVADAGKARRERGDLVHDLRRVRIVHRVAHGVGEHLGDLPVGIAGFGAITLRTRLMRRSALVKVPSFSRKDEPGRKTCA
jgi:hypothetical protein